MEHTTLDKSTKDRVRQIVGAANCSDRREDLFLYSYDAMNRKYLPDMVAHPESAEQVSSILKLANTKIFPVIPRGAGTGFTGGSLPVEGGLVLTTSRMNQTIEVDEGNMNAWVGAGVLNSDLQDAASRAGLFYPPDPSSMKYSTIGGNVAENAGGPRAVKYGVTRDYVMALEAVLPTGEIVNTGSAAIKSVTGYDLTRLFVGSEGTLAFITGVLLKLLPKPETVRTMLTSFPEIRMASEAVAKIMSSRIIPSTLEFMDRSAIDCVRGMIPDEYVEGAAALLLIEVDGDKATVDRQSETLELLCREVGAVGFQAAGSEEEREMLWKTRRSLSPAIMKIRPLKINEDVSVPRMKIPDLIEGVERIAKERDVTVVNFGHAGDGNVHVNILVDPDDTEEKQRAQEAVKDLFDLTVSLGGSLSGEHGIGIAKAPYMNYEIDEGLLEAMRRIKRALDPNNILNPAKTFDYDPATSAKEITRETAAETATEKARKTARETKYQDGQD